VLRRSSPVDRTAAASSLRRPRYPSWPLFSADRPSLPKAAPVTPDELRALTCRRARARTRARRRSRTRGPPPAASCRARSCAHVETVGLALRRQRSRRAPRAGATGLVLPRRGVRSAATSGSSSAMRQARLATGACRRASPAAPSRLPPLRPSARIWALRKPRIVSAACARRTGRSWAGRGGRLSRSREGEVFGCSAPHGAGKTRRSRSSGLYRKQRPGDARDARSYPERPGPEFRSGSASSSSSLTSGRTSTVEARRIGASPATTSGAARRERGDRLVGLAENATRR